MDEILDIEGSVESVIYTSEDNGYSVFSINLEQNLGVIICVGTTPSIFAGEHVKLVGKYVTHSLYGKQFAFSTLEKNLPTTESGVLRYLASGIIKGVGKGLAKRIVDTFGKDTLRVIEEYPEELAKVKGITLKIAEYISLVFHEQAESSKIIIFLQEKGISFNMAKNIYKRYKGNTIEIIKNNPYRPADEIYGIGFKIADSLASKIGIEKNSDFRIESGIKYTLKQESNNGHVYLPKNKLFEITAELLQLPLDLIKNSLEYLKIRGEIRSKQENGEELIYLPGFFYAENQVAKKLITLSLNKIEPAKNINSKIKKYEKQNSINLAVSQKKAIKEALTNGVLVITGGPGTGKTTIINAIISILNGEDDYKIELAAPTGRAAKKMSEATDMEAKTIHRLLEINFSGNNNYMQKLSKDSDNPIEADILIIDESSMIDILLMYRLLDAVSEGTRLILVGDSNQLPSVGAGNVLRDIICSDCIKVVSLKEIFRQASESAIVTNAHMINNGEYPIFNEKTKDFFFIKKFNIDEVIQTIVDLSKNRLPAFLENYSAQDLQILTPMRKSKLGVTNLNQILQESLNPHDENKKEKELFGTCFRVGDKVMQTKNNYNISWYVKNGNRFEEGLGIFNGDIGIIIDIDFEDESVLVAFDENKFVSYGFAHADELELSYSITVHKAQGSEYRAVIIPVHSGAPILMSRNLLYTAITRAKELVIIVGIPDMLKKMIENDRELSRYTSLDKRIIENFESL